MAHGEGLPLGKPEKMGKALDGRTFELGKRHARPPVAGGPGPSLTSR
ncbi:MAG: hypothetical protein H6Q90_7056, partial [Deltaproteobacteria bacterium]|nr:hypothetical protein [Deltaproteobacteria bacterium]